MGYRRRVGAVGIVAVLATGSPSVAAVSPAIRTAPDPGYLALTFDDGPHPRWTPTILDILDRHHAKATWFVLGVWVDRYPELSAEIVRRGHSLQSHTYHHHRLTRASDATIRRELAATNRAIREATGTTPTCMRPPYGSVNRRVREAVAEFDLEVIMWTQDAQDYSDFSTGRRLIRRAGEWGSADIVLAHDFWGRQWVESLDRVLTDLTARGIGFQTLCDNIPVHPPAEAR